MTEIGSMLALTQIKRTVLGQNLKLNYTSTDVLLSLTGQVGMGGSLAVNQGNGANAINAAFNNGTPLPAAFLPLFNLTGASLSNALTQLSGEVATGIQQRPICRWACSSTPCSILSRRDATARSAPRVRRPTRRRTPSRVQATAQDAMAATLPVKAPLLAPTFEQRWSVWGSAYGGRSRIDGDAAVGSSDTTATAGAFPGRASAPRVAVPHILPSSE